MGFSTFIIFSLGLAALITGAELLVRGASRLSDLMGISPLIIGLTVVSFGTSSPELAVSLQSGLSSMSDISIGNVVGSNIFNVLFILGISATITPLLVSRQLIKLDVPVMICVSVLLLILGYNGNLNKVDGLILTAGIFFYIVYLISINNKDRKNITADENKEPANENSKAVVSINILYIVAGLVLLVLGSRWLVNSSIQIAGFLEISELLVGLTVVAAGTSLPEVATSVVAALKGERDIAVGNVVGSNIFNILVILGITALVVPEGIEVAQSASRFDIPVMIAVAVATLPVFFTGYKISRCEGILFITYYILYITYLYFVVSEHAFISLFTDAIIFFVIPLTVITLVVFVYRNLRKDLS